MRIYAGPPLEVPGENLLHPLFRNAREHGDRPAFLVRQETGDGWRTLTWRDVADRVRVIANGLLSLGVQKGDRIAIVADTRAEWAIADYATLAVGGVSVSVFPILIPDQVLHLLNDSGSRIVIVENEEQYAKVREVAAQAKTVEKWVTMDHVSVAKDAAGAATMGWGALEDAGREYAQANPDALDARVRDVKPEDLATIIYTSGTTGVPKGVMLTHRNIVASVAASQKVLKLKQFVRGIGFLPLSHSYQRQSGFVIANVTGSVAFSSPRTLAKDLQSVKPEIMASVPRLYERMYEQIMARVGEQPERRQKIFGAAAATAREYGRAISDGGKAGLALRLRHGLFERLVYSKLRDALGFTNLEMTFTGAAAIRPDLLYFYQGIGVNILEGYGLTETIAPSNTNPPTRFRPGTVGPVFPGMEQMVDEDGEVLTRGPNVFEGYWQKPDENAASFAEIDGKTWYRTGDIGEFDDAGYLRIVDRKKELEILDTGKNVAPLPIEERMKASTFITEACVIGQGRKYCGALVQPNYDALVAWARKEGVPFDESKVVVKPDPTGNPMTYAVGRDLLDHQRTTTLMEREIAEANKHFAEFERVKAFRLVDHAFTIDRDELTISLKKKRRVIRAHYEGLIEEMFAGARASPARAPVKGEG